jgi:hypothetical protein
MLASFDTTDNNYWQGIAASQVRSDPRKLPQKWLKDTWGELVNG